MIDAKYPIITIICHQLSWTEKGLIDCLIGNSCFSQEYCVKEFWLLNRKLTETDRNKIKGYSNPKLIEVTMIYRKLYMIDPLQTLQRSPSGPQDPVGPRVPWCPWGPTSLLSSLRLVFVNLCCWHVIRKVIWYVTKLWIFEYSCNLFLIFFSKYKTETANRGQRQLLFLTSRFRQI